MLFLHPYFGHLNLPDFSHCSKSGASVNRTLPSCSKSGLFQISDGHWNVSHILHWNCCVTQCFVSENPTNKSSDFRHYGLNFQPHKLKLKTVIWNLEWCICADPHCDPTDLHMLCPFPEITMIEINFNFFIGAVIPITMQIEMLRQNFGIGYKTVINLIFIFYPSTP